MHGSWAALAVFGLGFCRVSSHIDQGDAEGTGEDSLSVLSVVDFVPMWTHRIRAADLHSLSDDPFGGGCLVFPRGKPVGDTLSLLCKSVFSQEANQAECVQHLARTIVWADLLGGVPGFSLDLPADVVWDYVLRVSIEIRFDFRGISGIMHCREGGLLSHAIDRYCTSLVENSAPLTCDLLTQCRTTVFRW